MISGGTTEHWTKTPEEYYQEALRSGTLKFFETRPVAYTVFPNNSVMLFEAPNEDTGTSSKLFSVIYVTSNGRDQVNFQPTDDGHYRVGWVTDSEHRMWNMVSSNFTYKHGWPLSNQGSDT